MFAVVELNLCDMNSFDLKLNSRFPSVQLTVLKLEKDDQFLCLDNKVMRKELSLEFDNFRRTTSFDRLRTFKTYCCKYKIATSNFFRRSLPLSKIRY